MTVVRYREENGKISRKHGSLRNTYGISFAPGCADHAKLSDVLAKFDELSLGQLIRDHEAGKLEQICRRPTSPGSWKSPLLAHSLAD
jgi:hypothetical protein